MRRVTTSSLFQVILQALVRILPVLACLWVLSPLAMAGQPFEVGDVFARFTAHISSQIQSDKQTFVDASTCTEWFYKQLRRKPSRPSVEGVSFPAGHLAGRLPLEAPECQSRYPGGLEAARQDFSRTQTSLALSLTFYEFALVGDRNDDDQYSVAELRDMIEAFGLAFDAAGEPAGHLAALKAKFDAVHTARGLDVLMESMGTLYDKGYRLTSRDRAALDRVSG